MGDLKPAIEQHEVLYQITKRHHFLPEAVTSDFQVSLNYTFRVEIFNRINFFSLMNRSYLSSDLRFSHEDLTSHVKLIIIVQYTGN